MSFTAQANSPSSSTLRSYRLTTAVFGLALVIVTALAVYLALHEPAPVPTPASNSETVTEGQHFGTVGNEPCFRPQVPC